VSKKAYKGIIPWEWSGWSGKNLTWNFALYKAHPVMTVHKISAVDMLCKDVEKLLEVGMYSWNSRHRARAA
jgi:hypothetical protein